MTFEWVRPFFEPVIRPLLHFYWRFSRGTTFGVRAIVIDGEQRVFLIKHSYVDGWHFPGGGVETGESAIEALKRELLEEGNIELTGAPTLHAVYFNSRVSRRDHVALYIVRGFRQRAQPVPDHEIIAHGFFARDALPDGTTQATRARLAEILDSAPIPDTW